MKRVLSCILICTMFCGCTIRKTTDYIIPDEIKSTETNIEYRTLIIDSKEGMYTYDDMKTDLETMALAYDGLVQLNILAQTLDDRNIYDLVIGDLNAEKHIIIHASIHAREYITSKLVMKQLSYYLNSLYNNKGQYKNISYKELFEDVAVHVLPMINPDGVTLSQSGVGGLNTQNAKDRVTYVLSLNGLSDNNEVFKNWKANANGVDLNRNFDAKWDEFIGSENPAPDRYKGKKPGSEPEARALIELTTRYPVKRTISYHTSGEVIYWYFGQNGDLYEESKKFADELSIVTGYPTDENYQNLDPAGYKDWALHQLSIPSITIEVGSGTTPVGEHQITSIYEQNMNVWTETLYNIKY